MVIRVGFTIERLPEEVLIRVATFLLPQSLLELCKVTKLFSRIANDRQVWNQIASDLKIYSFDTDHPKRDVMVYCKLDTSEREFYAFVVRMLGPIRPTDFMKIPLVGYIKTRQLVLNWAYPTSVVRVTTWDDCAHRYIRGLAFSTAETTHLKNILIVIESKKDPTPEKIDYLRRLMLGAPCGAWLQGQGETERKWKKTTEGRKSRVELCVPDREAPYRPQFIYFNG